MCTCICVQFSVFYSDHVCIRKARERHNTVITCTVCYATAKKKKEENPKTTSDGGHKHISMFYDFNFVFQIADDLKLK